MSLDGTQPRPPLSAGAQLHRNVFQLFSAPSYDGRPFGSQERMSVDVYYHLDHPVPFVEGDTITFLDQQDRSFIRVGRVVEVRDIIGDPVRDSAGNPIPELRRVPVTLTPVSPSYVQDSDDNLSGGFLDDFSISERKIRAAQGNVRYSQVFDGAGTSATTAPSQTPRSTVGATATSSTTTSTECEGIEYGRLNTSGTKTVNNYETDIPGTWTGSSLAVGDLIAIKGPTTVWFEAQVTRNDSGRFGFSQVGGIPNLAEWIIKSAKWWIVIGEHCNFTSQSAPTPPPPPSGGTPPPPPPVSAPPPPPNTDGGVPGRVDDSETGVVPGDQGPVESAFFTPFKHPDWAPYPEFYWDGQNYQVYAGSPGDYDPSTFVLVDAERYMDEFGNEIDPEQWPEIAKVAAGRGELLRKVFRIDRDPNSPTFGGYAPGKPVAGGTGARLFLTSEEVPDCSERSTAKESLGLPDMVDQVDAPAALVRALNDGLTGAGFDPDQIRFEVETGPGEIDTVRLITDFPAVDIDSPTPGASLGLPSGVYDLGALCVEAQVFENQNTNTQETLDRIQELYNDPSSPLGLLDRARINQILAQSGDPDFESITDPTYILNLLCVDYLGRRFPDGTGAVPTGPFPLNDNNSVFHEGVPNRVRELYRYEITNLFGETVRLGGTTDRQQTDINILESKRFNDSNQIESQPQDLALLSDSNTADSGNILGTTGLSSEANAWVDNYQGEGWAYLENGEVKLRQEPLTDIRFISEAKLYEAQTGLTTLKYDFWDPFKGVIPGFIRNEIHYISDTDPVAYSDSRTTFGHLAVGKVWWDTSTVRYQWYEQGTNRERRRNWAKAFPGSSITVCEWVESRAKPENWTGNGIPRWPDRYITERRQNPDTGEYQLYYYYWVQNRSVIDDRVARDWNRRWDTQTIARYIANPVGAGLNLISFVSDNGLLLTNTTQDIDDADQHLQVKFSRNQNPDGLDHTAWKLVREGDASSIVPENLSDKLIDSLCGENAIGQPVPDPTLSVVERLGTQFRPRQSMFRDIKSARRVMVSVLNDVLAGIRVRSQFPAWTADFPASPQYIQIVDWFAVRRTDSVTNTPIRYDATVKPVFSVDSVSDLQKLRDLPDGTVVQVRGDQIRSTQLWKFSAPISDFELISAKQETARLRDSVFQDDTNPALSAELRTFLLVLRDQVFENTEFWNTFFFEMVKHAYLEQQQLDWAFKTTFLNVQKSETDLVEFTGFKPDNFQKVLDYMNEVKPYSAKIREFRDTKRAPIELVGENSLSDFDKPAYPDPETGTVRSLDPRNGADWEIMRLDGRYTKFRSALESGDIRPVRRTTTRLVFDRTNWEPTQFVSASLNQTAPVIPINLSMARNFSNLILHGEQIDNLRAIDRVFLYDSETQAAFNNEISLYTGTSNAASNTSISANTDLLFEILEAGQFRNTLLLLKEKSGGGWRGETLNGNGFQSVIDQDDYDHRDLTEFGFGVDGWDQNVDGDVIEQNVVYDDDTGYFTVQNTNIPGAIGVGDLPWDTTTEIVSYEGVFNTQTQGNVTLVRNGEIYSGFDGITFQRVLYGEERPEELVQLSPLENFVLTVRTEPWALGTAQVSVETTTVGNAQPGTTEINLADVGNVDLDYWIRSASNSQHILGQVVEVGNSSVTIDRPLDTELVSNTQIVASLHEQVSASATEVTYRVHNNLFGGSDYLRITPDTSTELAQPLQTFDAEVVLADGSFLPEATTGQPGKIWVGTELIFFGFRSGNTLSLLTRGALGTSIQDHDAGTPVYSSETSELFNDLEPQANIWLDQGKAYDRSIRWDQAVQLAGADGILGTADDLYEPEIVWDYLAQSNITVLSETGTASNVSNTSVEVTLASPLSVETGEGVKIINTDTVSNVLLTADTVAGTSNVELSDVSNISMGQGIFADYGSNTQIFVGKVTDITGNVVSLNSTWGSEDSTLLPSLDTGDTLTFVNYDVLLVDSVANTSIVLTDIIDTLDSSVQNGSNLLVQAYDYGDQSADGTWDSALELTAGTALSLTDRANANFTASASIMRFLHRL